MKTPERLTDEVLRPAKSLEEESAHLKQLQVQIDALTSVTAAGIVGPPQVDSTTGEPHTGAMIALVPKAPPMWVLEYPQAEEADSLHVTLAYLGDTDLIPDHILYSLEDSLNLLGRHTPVIEGKVFGASVWNAESDTPSLNLAVGGPALEYMHDYVRRLLFNLDEDFDWEPPEQHLPWVAHMCLAYGDSDALTGVLDDALKLEGPIEFDRIRLAYGGEAIDFALVPREMVAAAEPLPEPGPPPTYEPPVTPVTPILPAGTVALDDLVRIERAWRKEIQQVIIPELEKTMRKAADAVLESISFEAPVLWDASHPAAQLFLTQTANQLVGVGEDMWERTRDQLIMGMQEGDSIQQLSARVKEVLSTTDTRARMIARTEVIAASNAGAMQQLEMLGEDAPAQKTWLATHDARTRLSHMAANGQTVDFVMPFTVGGAKFDYPGDPDAPASERVNCRCTLTWHFEDLPLQSIRSAGVLEMFKGHDRYVRDNHGRFAPKGGGGGGGATGGEKKVLKPAHVDTKRLNPAEAAELADIQAKHKSGELSDKEAKYKTYYVKVKASKRINKSGGGGGGGAGGAEKKLEPEKTPTPPWKEPGYAGHNKPSEPKVSYVPSSGMKSSGPLSPVAKGDTVSTPAGVGKVVGTDGDLVSVQTPDGGKYTYPKHKVYKKESSPKPKSMSDGDLKKGDTVDTPGGPGKVLGHDTNNVLVEHPNGKTEVYDKKPPTNSHPYGTKPKGDAKVGDFVDTPIGPGTVVQHDGKSVIVDHNGKLKSHLPDDVAKANPKTPEDVKSYLPGEKKLAPVGSVNTGTPTHTPATKKFTKPSEVKETQLNSAEYDELYSLTKANKDGTLSDAEFKKKAYYVKVKASKRINKNAGVSKPTPGGGSTSSQPKISYVPGKTVPITPGTGGLEVVGRATPEVPPELKSKYSATRKVAAQNAELLHKKSRNELVKDKQTPTNWDDPHKGPMLKAHSAYTGSGYTPINGLARTGKIPPHSYMQKQKAAEHIQNLDRAFDAYGIQNNQPLVVHRGVRGSYASDLGKLKPGDIITERGYISTSTKEDAPKGFGSGGKMLEIHVPPGKKMIAGTDYENELLFPRNQQMQYVGTSATGALQFKFV